MKLIKVLSFIVVVVLLFSLPVSANNNADTEYSYSLLGTGYYAVIRPGRYKSDNSPSYVKLNNTCSEIETYGVNFSIHGGNNTQDPLANCTSYVSSCRIYPGSGRRIHTNVYEWNYSYAFVGVNAPHSSVVGKTASGVWSPDSTGSSPFAN